MHNIYQYRCAVIHDYDNNIIIDFKVFNLKDVVVVNIHVGDA